MHKIIYKAIIEDSNGQRLSQKEQEALLNIFNESIRYYEHDLEEQTAFTLADNEIAQAYGVEDFSCLLLRETVNKKDQWKAIFNHENRMLQIIAVLEIEKTGGTNE